MKTQMPQSADLDREYTAALRSYLRRGGEAALLRAYKVGRRGLGEGRGVLRMLAMHREAMVEVMNGGDRTKFLDPGGFERASAFFSESMSPFEMTHLAFAEANAALHQMNEDLENQLKHIAHALHDDAGQLLAAVHLSLDMVERELAPEARSRLSVIKKHLDDVYQQLRHLSHELRPTILDDLGLGPAIEFLSEGVSRRSGLRISVRALNGPRLPVAVETVLYRVIQEALTNVDKHAHAKAVKIRFRNSAKGVRCSIVDDGVGFYAEGPRARSTRHGLGLMGMREKLQPLGGSLKIESTPGHGTRLLITVPRRD
jgi:two-component system, NarL family, sensor histidine kinase UhpB